MAKHPERSGVVFAAQSKDAAHARALRPPSTAFRPKNRRNSAQDAYAQFHIWNRWVERAFLDIEQRRGVVAWLLRGERRHLVDPRRRTIRHCLLEISHGFARVERRNVDCVLLVLAPPIVLLGDRDLAGPELLRARIGA
jgi:cbb3-type cytochrome oxidase subunit 3